jgi:hypothetical protein
MAYSCSWCGVLFRSTRRQVTPTIALRVQMNGCYTSGCPRSTYESWNGTVVDAGIYSLHVGVRPVRVLSSPAPPIYITQSLTNHNHAQELKSQEQRQGHVWSVIIR